jgi:hypothetical protein
MNIRWPLRSVVIQVPLAILISIGGSISCSEKVLKKIKKYHPSVEPYHRDSLILSYGMVESWLQGSDGSPFRSRLPEFWASQWLLGSIRA